jgi:hypothetical protein
MDKIGISYKKNLSARNSSEMEELIKSNCHEPFSFFKKEIIKTGTDLEVAEVVYLYKILDLEWLPMFYRNDILNMDEYYDNCITEVEKFGDFGPAILALYIDWAIYNRTKACLGLLHIAKEIEMTHQLYSKISENKKLSRSIKSPNERYTPELQNQKPLNINWSIQYSYDELKRINVLLDKRRIGFSDATFSEVLDIFDELLSKPIKKSHLDSLNPEVYILCNLCEKERGSILGPADTLICHKCRDKRK